MADLNWIFPSKPKIATERWEWPAAMYRGSAMRHAAYILCEDEYHETSARLGNHRLLHVCIMKYNAPGNDPSIPRRMLYRDTQFRRLEHAIQWAQFFINQNPSWQPTLI